MRGRQRHQFGHRVAEAGESPERPATERQRDQTEDRDDLERDAVREDDVERDDHQRRHHHVEAVEREAVVPVVAPAAELEVRQQVVAQVGRRHHVRAHVATGRRVVLEHEVEVDHLQHREGRATDQDQRGEVLDDSLVGPRRVEPVRAAGAGCATRSASSSGRRAARVVGVVGSKGSSATTGSSISSVMSAVIVSLRDRSYERHPPSQPQATSTRPVALNAMCATMLIPRRPCTQRADARAPTRRRTARGTRPSGSG